ncbi:MAG: Bax inhibitor-1/YccA family protein [Alphaproteobacteria bacterium]|nr:Bax inhibitor-1/YccA family protein [Alphaproteobacteria bacterium]
MDQNRDYMTQSQATYAEYDAGLRSYMLSVYNYMGGALTLTGVVAYATYVLSVAGTNANGQILLTGLGQAIYLSPLKWVVMLAPLGMVFLLSARIRSMSFGGAQVSFAVFAALMGLSLSSIFLQFQHESIAKVFFITAATFGALSIYGYTTKKNLSGMGTFLFMGVIGVLIASVVNIFLGSAMLQFVISVGGVLVFAGLTAYDTQNIKNMYSELDSSDSAGKKAIFGALQLYLDFINMFMFMLQLFGNRE